jgi:hypothetical protein
VCLRVHDEVLVLELNTAVCQSCSTLFDKSVNLPFTSGWEKGFCDRRRVVEVIKSYRPIVCCHHDLQYYCFIRIWYDRHICCFLFADQNFPFMKVVIVGFEITLGVTVKFIMDSDNVLYRLKYYMKFEMHSTTLRLQSYGRWCPVVL